METNFKKIRVLLEVSPLKPEEIDELSVALLLVSDEELKPIHNLLITDIQASEVLFKNFKEKKELVANGADATAWEDVVAEEETLLQKV